MQEDNRRSIDPRKMPWGDLQSLFVLDDVRIIATFGHDGGAIVELVSKLECIEGRRFATGGECADRESAAYLLEYHFSFGVAGAPEPLAGQMAEARIVITGKHSNGKRIEIRGNGWVGYENDGNIEGVFESPPAMITEDTEFPPVEGEDGEEIDPQEFLEQIRRDYRMPQQFEDALVRVPAREWYDEGD